MTPFLAEAIFSSQDTCGFAERNPLDHRHDHPAPEAICPPVHLRLRDRLDSATEKLALRAALSAAHLLGLAVGQFLRGLREGNDPLAKAAALLKEADLRASLAWDIVEILGARLDKIPDRQRPYYTPAQRFRILEIKSLLGWNRDLIARLFRVCTNTISNWEQNADPDSKTVGSTVKPIPPITRFADISRNLVQTMLRLKFGARTSWPRSWLVRAGRSRPARSVASDVRTEPGQLRPRPAASDLASPSSLVSRTTSG